jgi:hypothetical protein
MRAAAVAEKASMFDITAGIRTSYYQWCARLYDVFGVSGKA